MQKNQQKIVLIGGPGTGKSTVLNKLREKDFFCFDEVSREVILKAQKKGIEQLFLTEPLLFSEMLLEGREEQYLLAENRKENIIIATKFDTRFWNQKTKNRSFRNQSSYRGQWSYWSGG